MNESSGFLGRDIVSIRDLSRAEIERIISVAKQMVPIAKGTENSKMLEGKILSTLFFEPSTRTRLSFESAMMRLGGGCLGFSEVSGTSVMKGETLADTTRMAASYSDVIVLRHNNEGAARMAAEFSDKPVINAGDGAGQHPTQTLLDIFTINELKGKIDDINIVLVGDLKYGRTVHSLSYALSMFKPRLTFVAPPTLQMPVEILEHLEKRNIPYTLDEKIENIIQEADILYVTRIQKERFPDPNEYQKVVGSYRIDMDLLSNAKKTLSVMHPLPRVKEIDPAIDSTAHAQYFNQAFNGVPVRMALLAMVLGAVK